jgi:hypothetical protein
MMTAMMLMTAISLGATAPTRPVPAQPTCCPIVELRQYTLQPDTRDRFVALFERQFIESQEAVGIQVIGQFRDSGDANRFVWLRGFADMPARLESLQAFYGAPAPAWKAHREEANSMIVDSDNVLLLHPVRATSAFAHGAAQRPPLDAGAGPAGTVVAIIYSLQAPLSDDFVDFFEHQLKPELGVHGIAVGAYFASETSTNNFPRLPVREGENIFVWFATFKNPHDQAIRLAALERSQRWKQLATELQGRLKSAPQILELSPTPRSLLHG